MTGFAERTSSQDVPPFMMVDGNPLAVRGINVEGLRRRGFTPSASRAVKQMHRLLYRDGPDAGARRAPRSRRSPGQAPEAPPTSR